ADADGLSIYSEIFCQGDHAGICKGISKKADIRVMDMEGGLKGIVNTDASSNDYEYEVKLIEGGLRCLG
ncbi:MAG: hypothetical protein SCM11_11600, partial [Bacillota bacterium]|nr:hypothetical protein [Bacillota bacterium]